MAGFPPNLDDGELWLPSDVFPEEIYDSKHLGYSNFSPNFPCEVTYMEELAHQLAFAMLEEQQRQTYKRPPNLASNVELKSPHFVTGRLHSGGFTGFPAIGHNSSSFGNRAFRFGPKPAQSQVEGFLQTRFRNLQRQQNPNRLLPFRLPGSTMTGFNRESGGTGVFFPRVFHNNLVPRKKPSLKSSSEGRQQNKNGVMEKQGMSFQAPTELRLPQDWTY